MKPFFERLQSTFGWAALSYLFIGIGQIFFSALLSPGMAFLFILLACVSAMLTRFHKGKTYQEIVSARPPGANPPWRRRSEQMLSCGVLTVISAATAAASSGPAAAFGLASCVCFALAGSFAMNDTSELAPAAPKGPQGPQGPEGPEAK